MRRARSKIAPNLVSAARSSTVATTNDVVENVNKDVAGESDAALSKTRPPLTPSKKSPAKDNVDNQYQLPTSSSTENIKSDKKKCVEKPIEIKKAVTKRKLAGGSVEVDRSMLTMGYFIKNNPADGQRPQNTSEKLHMRKRPFEVAELSKKSQAVLHAQSTRNAILDDRLAGEDVIRIEGNPEDEGEGSTMPVPQVCLGLHGEIILDEKSLVIDTSETKRNKSQLANSSIRVENNPTMVNYGSWRKTRRTGPWKRKETARFYTVLQMFGTDFSLIEQHFPGRSRNDLKKKIQEGREGETGIC